MIKNKIILSLAAVAVTLAPSGAISQIIKDGRYLNTDEYVFVRKEFERENPNIIYHEYNRPKFKLAVNKYGAKARPGSRVRAFALVDVDPNKPDAPCHIHYVKGGNQREMQESLEHEILHCKYGRWHD